ncbi:Abi-alpha family protein [Comamonas sp. B21-038]|uniref:Abi-alpha family protein n=1 Tax=Comamonas sp. B21-038 TaxID=2918299 RepID=UPI001EFBFAE9|nr:Abi-alpha family protein [Comamonas sp. B21-038]ULR89734.1 DUF4393 domain-containing protein [Comamonas sp. B21-038]
MGDSDPVSESAVAVQEVAKTTRSAIEATRDAGSFLAKYLDGPLVQMSGLLEDTLRYRRGVRLIRLEKRFQEELQANGTKIDVKRLPINFALSVLEEGSLEEDDDLQDLWARLLANVADAGVGVSPRRAYISLIKDLSPLDALVFELIYSVPDVPNGKPIVTYQLPQKAFRADGLDKADILEPSEEIVLSLANLERLGLLSYGPSWGGGEIFKYVNKTVPGRDFMKAIGRRSAI